MAISFFLLISPFSRPTHNKKNGSDATRTTATRKLDNDYSYPDNDY